MNKSIFGRSSIEKAVNDYGDFANIAVSETDKYWILQFSDFKYDEEQTVMEFENYLIGLENAYM